MELSEFSETFSGLSNDKGKLIFSGGENKKRFFAQIKQQYDRILFTHGAVKYKELWGYDFPMKELEKLGAAL